MIPFAPPAWLRADRLTTAAGAAGATALLAARIGRAFDVEWALSPSTSPIGIRIFRLLAAAALMRLSLSAGTRHLLARASFCVLVAVAIGGIPGAEVGLAIAVLVAAASHVSRFPAYDALDQLSAMTGAWLLATATVALWQCGASGAGAAAAGIAIALGLVIAASGAARDARRVAWIGRVQRGLEPGWRLLHSPLAAAIPPLVSAGRTRDYALLLLKRKESGQSATGPFRAAPVEIAVARLSDRVRPGALTAVRRLLGAALMLIAAPVAVHLGPHEPAAFAAVALLVLLLGWIGERQT